MSRVLVVGASGLLGREVMLRLSGAVASSRRDLDLSGDAIALPNGEWSAVVNCAAYTAVERAESEPEAAWILNARGPALLAQACRARRIPLLHVSTDFVFDGDVARAYREDDPPRPLGVYGRTKREGEERVLAADPDATIVRTAWLFGDGPCFPETIARRFAAGERLRVVDDTRGSPTWTADVARAIALLLRTGASGIHHVAGDEAMSWRGFAERTLLALTGEKVGIEGVGSDAYPSAVRRPRNSTLDNFKMRGLGWAPTPLDAALEAWAAARNPAA